VNEHGATLVFDGDCGFCTTAAMWAARGHVVGPLEIVAWQNLGVRGLADMGVSVPDAQKAAWWVDESGARWRGHRAVAMALRSGRGWRSPAGRLLLVPPVSWVAAGVYPVVARFRHLLPGATPACRAGGP
jgi:predicted DCC family thiol-disulfide oxidoreductase YuxK